MKLRNIERRNERSIMNRIFDTKWKNKMRQRYILLVLYDNPQGLLEEELCCYVYIVLEALGIDDIL